MDGPQEYEVESVTRARVHDKKGKKITWKYYVKWKGYDWDESTWEPTESFQGGSEHILEAFWERVDTGGRDISNATAFKKGEELLVSGPPGKKPLKRKANPAKTMVSPSNEVPDSATISAPLLSPRKRQRVQLAAGDEWKSSKRKLSSAVLRNGRASTQESKRRRASSPGPRKSASKRLPSAGDSQLDADGETDPDVIEVEDELMQVGDVGEDGTQARHPNTARKVPNGTNDIAFDDLLHFYSGHPIDIDENMDEQSPAQKLEAQPQLQSSPSPGILVPPTSATSGPKAPASPGISSYDPLFDSPPHHSDQGTETQGASILSLHRARAAKPLVKLINTTKLEGTSKHSRITAKARLMSLHTSDMPSPSDSDGKTAKRGKKVTPSRASSSLDARNRSSLLTATKGTLKSVKGKFASTMEHDQPDEFKDVPSASEGDQLHVTSCSDDVDQERLPSNFQPGTPSGDELLKLAGLKADPEPLPDYEDDAAAQLSVVQTQNVTPTPTEERSNHLSIKAKEVRTDEQIVDSTTFVSEARQQATIYPVDHPSVPLDVAPPVDEAMKKNIELAKEHLFPSTQASFDSFNTTQSSFCSTIFGPLYQGSTATCAPVAKNAFSTAFTVTLGDGVELPLILKDCGEITRIGDILIGNSSGGRVALFYSAEDALAIVGTLKSDGTARVGLDPSAEAIQQGHFSTFLQRFESFHTLIAPVGSEVCVLYSSENTDIAEKLGTPAHLRGLLSTLLISHASIENQTAYVGAIMKATVL